MVIEDDNDDDDQDSVVLVRASGASKESIRKTCQGRIEAFSTNNNDNGLMNNDSPPIGVNKGSMTVKRMDELMLRCTPLLCL